ncbi:hypothetical protein MTR67_017697 [Solanum verrucosum]|uniref:Ubiquitin-like protease family profile domain-containing protein n=1 Tax=Solanum verrucosum TaxID=315347 RepID=A0AAF0QIE9_SOLVR|nr:hypothetical protein MTR67_017697 [Solanum verrucosum]
MCASVSSSRYLQKTKPHADVDEYHFFNTYFYQKLKEAVLSKQNEKEASFVRLRRWWKGVNIFEKAYIFLPIHEEMMDIAVLRGYLRGLILLRLGVRDNINVSLRDTTLCFGCGLWRNIMEEWDYALENISVKVRDGRRVNYWGHKWGHTVEVFWDLRFRREFQDWEVLESGDEPDDWWWGLGNDGVFSVKSFYEKPLVREENVFPCNATRIPKVPCKTGEDVDLLLIHCGLTMSYGGNVFSLHWSLVVICIPDKEDQLGPILLHLDSLGLHCSKSLFATIRKTPCQRGGPVVWAWDFHARGFKFETPCQPKQSVCLLGLFLVEEWKFLRQGEVPALPISDKIWENLPRRIDENIIQVPQQRNEYDCGLFVLFFMERFIDEVHRRLKKKDFTMFGRRWFKPEEASCLRMKIHRILEEEFKNASEND